MAIERCAWEVAPKRRWRGAYVAELARWPSVWGTFLGSLITSGLAGAAALPFVATVLGAVWLGSGSIRLQARLDRAAADRACDRRHAAREARLDAAHASAFGFRAARALVGDIQRQDRRLGTWLDLEGLLDRYVDLAVAGARCRRVLAAHDRYEMIRALGRTPVRHEARRVLIEHRLAAWDTCRLRLQIVEDQLAAITELLQLVAERVRFATADVILEADLVDRRLALVDA